MSEPGSIYRCRIPEYTVLGMRLGRHVEHDPRSLSYPAEGAEAITDVIHAAHGLPLNQGNVGSCTANALCGAQNCDPFYPLTYPSPITTPLTEADAVTLYERETADEGQPYPQYDPGGSGLAVCKAARELGWLTRYAWAFSLDAGLRALVLRPFVLGCNWYDSMDTPDSNGLVTISANASVRGGHEIVAVQIITEGQLVGFWNSWGPTWGAGGMFFMSYATLEQLLSEDGDIKVPGAAIAE